MKSFLYTIAVLFGALTVAQAANEANKKPVAEEVILEEVSVEAPVEAPAKAEETK